MSRSPHRPWGSRTMLLALALAVGIALAGTLLATSPTSAQSGSPTGSGATGGSGCPADNPPNTLTLVSGTPQTAQLDAAFAGPLQVTIANTDGCPITTAVAGTTVTFSAPSTGPSGIFSASGSSSVTVGADATGSASAAMFTANDVAGSYTVTASSAYGSVSFSLTNTAVGVAATITPHAPASQQATVATHYASPLAVQVLDANGNPVQDATVTFTLGAGSAGGGGGSTAGSSSAGASFDGGSSQATARTNSSGIATSPLFAANDVAGSFTATAATDGVSEPASFGLDNLAGPPPTTKLVPGGRRSATVDTRYADPLEVQVLDAAGNPIPGTTVTFTLGSSGAGSGAGNSGGSAGAGASFLDGSTQASETTDAGGDATSPAFRANATPGAFTATIAVSGVLNPLVVTLDNLAGKAATIRLVAGAHRSATVGSRYVRPLEVSVVSANGQPVQGATVTFALGSGGAGAGAASGGSQAGASFLDGSAQVTETTGAGGVAVSPHFTANDSAGTFTATASVSGLTNPAIFTLENLAPRLTPGAHPPQTATVGRRYRSPLQVIVLGTHGRPVQGVTVTFTLGAAASGGTSGTSGSAGASFVGGGTQATATTGAAGRASSPVFTANTVAGAFTATASISGTTRIATFALRNSAGTPYTVSAGAAASEQTTVATTFPIPLAVTVDDKDGNPVANTPVTFTAPASGASGRFATASDANSVTVQTNSKGIAVAPTFAANDQEGGYIVTATFSGVGAAAFALVNLAP